MVDGRGRRPRRPGRQALDRQGRARGRPHGPPRRRQVRRRRLQGVRRPPRRRRQRRQRAVGVAARRVGPRRRRLGPGVRARQAHDGRSRRSGRRATARGTTTQLPRRPRDVRDDRLLVRHDLASACASRPTSPRASGSRSSTSASTASGRSTSRAASQSFVRHLNRNKEALHHRPIYVERARGHDRRRGRPPVQRHLHRERPRVRQQHQHGRRRHPRHRLPGRAHELAQRLGAQGRRPQGRRRATSPATTSARA